MILLTVNLAGLWTYYDAPDLLNTAYLVPNQDMAKGNRVAFGGQDTVVWIDGLNFDGTTLEYYLPKSFRVRWLTSPESVAAARS